MTGFARREAQHEWGSVTCEMRAVNHRFLETHLRLPEELRSVEGELRKRVGKAIRRGKVDVSLRVRYLQRAGAGISVDTDLARDLVEAAGEIGRLTGARRKIDPLDILRWPGVVVEPDRDNEPAQKAALAVLGDALSALNEMRADEGRRTGEFLVARLDAMADLLGEVRTRLPEVREASRSRLLERLAQLPLDSDDVRLEQEMVIQAHKMDVDEELDRLDSHIAEARAALGRREPVGRRLDFLLQEFNREANTLASKSQDSETTRCAVEMKVLIEQLREQVQNVE